MPRIFITRHAQSCNNIASIWNKVVEPNITEYGVETAFSFPLPEEIQKQHRVYVSPLLRTWMTALGLYGRSCGRSLTLNVCAYLKEYHFHPFDYGNLPTNLSDQLALLESFLSKVKDSLDPELQDIHIVMVKDLAVFDVQHLATFNKSKNGEWKPANVAVPFEQYPPDFRTYYPDGIQRFVRGLRLQQDTVCAVAHSKVMRSYLKARLMNNLNSFLVRSTLEEETLVPFTALKKQNLWSIDLSGEGLTLWQGVFGFSRKGVFGLSNSIEQDNSYCRENIPILRLRGTRSHRKSRQSSPGLRARASQPQSKTRVSSPAKTRRKWFGWF